jgi:hypothetical protein
LVFTKVVKIPFWELKKAFISSRFTSWLPDLDRG